jgi:hypothetical protein
MECSPPARTLPRSVAIEIRLACGWKQTHDEGQERVNASRTNLGWLSLAKGACTLAQHVVLDQSLLALFNMFLTINHV